MTKCAACGETGGRFILRGDNWYHADRCARPTGMRDTAKNLFPFVTMNIGSGPEPIKVQSLRHLRKLENAHGVASEVFNNDQSYQGERY